MNHRDHKVVAGMLSLRVAWGILSLLLMPCCLLIAMSLPVVAATPGGQSDIAKQFCNTSRSTRCQKACTNSETSILGVSFLSYEEVANAMLMYACAGAPADETSVCCKVYTVCGYRRHYALANCNVYTGVNPSLEGSRCFATVHSPTPCPTAKKGTDWVGEGE